MIIDIYQRVDSAVGPLGASGDVCSTKEHSTGHEPWYASRESPEKPWRVTIKPSRLPWLSAAKPLIRALLEAGGHVWVKIQAPENLERTGEQTACGLCSTIQGGRAVEGSWTAATRTGRRWAIKYTENPPEPQLQPRTTAFIRAVLKAVQSN